MSQQFDHDLVVLYSTTDFALNSLITAPYSQKIHHFYEQVKSSQRKWAHPVPKMDKRNNIEIRGRH